MKKPKTILGILLISPAMLFCLVGIVYNWEASLVVLGLIVGVYLLHD